MTREEIMRLLDAKIEAAIEIAQQDHGEHNNEAWRHYYGGVAQGLTDAKAIVGMLDKPNKCTFD